MDAAIAEADALMRAGRIEPAAAKLRPFAQDPTSPKAAIDLCYLLAANELGEDAIKVIAPRALASDASLAVLSAYGAALKSAGRLEEAVKVYQRACIAAPQSAVAEHNLAAALGDGHWFAQAEAASARALQKGLDGPETWLVRARALQGLGRFDDAERAYRQCLLRRPNSADAHAELSQLIWVRTEDESLACQMLDEARGSWPADADLARARSKFLDSIGDRDRAYRVLADTAARPGVDPMLHADATLMAMWVDGAKAVDHARLAMKVNPEHGAAIAALCQAYLATGEAALALPLAEDLRRRWPLDQFAINLVGMCWRLLGDARYRELYDYDRLVRHGPIDTPQGWTSLEAYLADLKVSLEGLHRLRGHPIGQSLRNGTQTPQSLDRIQDPAIMAFFNAIDLSVQTYLASLERDGMALGRPYARGGRCRVDKAWSIRLRPGGFHVSHIHPKGWISSACHISLPPAIESGHEGWLGFGEPGLPTSPALPAEHFVKPEPGHIALFPSYMWHGTVPFSGEGERLGIALDLLPA